VSELWRDKGLLLMQEFLFLLVVMFIFGVVVMYAYLVYQEIRGR